MLTAYATALPPSAVPTAASTLAVVGMQIVLAVLFAALAVVAGAVVPRMLATSRKRPALRLVGATAAGAASRHAA